MAGAMTPWDPFADVAELRDRLDRFFGETRGREWMPAIDVVRHDGELVLRADVPGMSPDEIKVDVEDDVLTVSGKHEESKEEKDEHFVRRERRYGSFSRSMMLPHGVDPEQIKAKTTDGVLELTIPLPSQGAKHKVSITPTAGE